MHEHRPNRVPGRATVLREGSVCGGIVNNVSPQTDQVQRDEPSAAAHDHSGPEQCREIYRKQLKARNFGFQNPRRLCNTEFNDQIQNVILTDVTAPVADSVSLPDLTDMCGVTSVTAPTATDNCMGTITGTTTDRKSTRLNSSH